MSGLKFINEDEVLEIKELVQMVNYYTMDLHVNGGDWEPGFKEYVQKRIVSLLKSIIAKLECNE